MVTNFLPTRLPPMNPTQCYYKNTEEQYRMSCGVSTLPFIHLLVLFPEIVSLHVKTTV